MLLIGNYSCSSRASGIGGNDPELTMRWAALKEDELKGFAIPTEKF
jgi:hypothetical protein